MLMELDGSGNAVRSYTCGLDLAGQNGSVNDLQSAGGIGGVLAVHDASSSEDYVYCYDANGNVGQLVAYSADVLDDGQPPQALGTAWHVNRLVARYDYDPYGAIVGPDTDDDGDFDEYDEPGTYAAANPIRFSTKYWDDETGLGCWGYRYYDLRLGRWMSRDPIGEAGGVNLYAYVANRPACTNDPTGTKIYYMATTESWMYVHTHGVWPWTCTKAYHAGFTANVAEVDSGCCCDVKYLGFTDYSSMDYTATYRYSFLPVHHSFDTVAKAHVSTGACQCGGRTVDGLEITVHHLYRTGGVVKYKFTGGIEGKYGKLGAEIAIPPAQHQVQVIWKVLVCPSGEDYGEPSATLLSRMERIFYEQQSMAHSGPFWWDLVSTTRDVHLRHGVVGAATN